MVFVTADSRDAAEFNETREGLIRVGGEKIERLL